MPTSSQKTTRSTPATGAKSIVNNRRKRLYTQISRTCAELTTEQAIVKICDDLELPKLRTRKGLRQMHSQLHESLEILGSLYSAAYSAGDWPVLNVVIGIWLHISSDEILCQGLLARGVLPDVLTLFRARSRALNKRLLCGLLAFLARFGNYPIKREIMETAHEDIMEIMEVNRDSCALLVELALAAFAHALQGTLRGPVQGDPLAAQGGQVYNQEAAPVSLPFFDSIPELLLLAPEVFVDPGTPHHVMNHVLMIFLFVMYSRHLDPQGPASNPICDSALRLLTALVTSNNINLRCFSLWLFETFMIREADSPRKRPIASYNLHHLSDYQRAGLSAERERKRKGPAMVALMRVLYIERDIYAFGRNLADLALQVPDISLPPQTFEGIPGLLAGAQLQIPEIPYKTWADCLCAGADALRAHGDDIDLDRADILHLELTIESSPPERTIALARQVLARNPRHAIARYTLCLYLPSFEEAMQMISETLELPDFPPLLRHELLMYVMDAHFSRAWKLLLGTPPSPCQADTRRMATRLLIAGLEYAQALVAEAEAAGNMFCLVRAIDAYITQTIVLRGAKLNEEFEEFAPLLRTREEARDALEIIASMDGHDGYPDYSPHVFLSRCLKDVGVGYYMHAVAKYDRNDTKRRFGEDPAFRAQLHTTGDNDSDLFAPMAPLRIGVVRRVPPLDIVNGLLRCQRCLVGGAGATDFGPALYRCATCGKCTALVRECKGCHGEWYCDEACQRSHWPEHRIVCRIRS
ncbi:hypothetical protein C8Q80DRAFT_756207 [Daedaleopsis nitida]|nr:hypothetical protein C8Q80DRAFT_756207 [Daedaleopsis nitida]